MQYNRFHLRRDARIDASQWRGWLIYVLDHYSGRNGRVEWHSFAEHFVEYDSHTVDVRPIIKLLTKALFRRHIVRRSHDTSRLRQMTRGVIAKLCDSEVEYFHPQP